MSVVRAGAWDDLAAVVRLERETGTAPHWSIAEYEGMLVGEATVQRRLYVAVDGDALIGFGVGRVTAEEGEVESIAVKESARRRGVGRELLHTVMNWCRGAGAETIHLEVRAGSGGALRLYQAAMFREVGRRRSYYSEPVEDAVLMRWSLLDGRGTS